MTTRIAEVTETATDTVHRTHPPALTTVAAAAAAAIVVTMLGEILITVLPGGSVTPTTVAEWFALLDSRPFMGLRNLGLLNIISAFLGIPVTFALYRVLRRTAGATAPLALIIGYLGTATFLSTNRAFPMLALSGRYTVAATEVERATLAAAGEALLAVGASHTPGTVLGFLLMSVAGVLNAVLMLRNGAFRKATAILALLGSGLLLVFDSAASFVPAWWDALMVVAVIGGLSSITGYALIAHDLRRLGAAGGGPGDPWQPQPVA